jgi:hypothetical protein
MQILNVHKKPSRYATITEMRKRKAMSTSQRWTHRKKPRQTPRKQDRKDSSADIIYKAANPARTQPCHPMRTPIMQAKCA